MTLIAMMMMMVGMTNGANITVGASGRMHTTMQAALDSAQAGDTIFVDDGTYNEGKMKRR
jgi:pectin methylesterase-like acyl-CoA thioesterase